MRLCYDQIYRDKMIEAQKANTNPNACRDILKLIERLIDEKKSE